MAHSIIEIGITRRKTIREELISAYQRAVKRGDHLAASRFETIMHARNIAPCHYRVCGEVDPTTGIQQIDTSHFPGRDEIIRMVPDIHDPEGEFPAIPDDLKPGKKLIL